MSSSTAARPPTYEELVALVHQLRQQLAEQDQEIAHFKRQLAEGRVPPALDAPIQQAAPAVLEEPTPGSQADLLTQLEKIYPEGR